MTRAVLSPEVSTVRSRNLRLFKIRAVAKSGVSSPRWTMTARLIGAGSASSSNGAVKSASTIAGMKSFSTRLKSSDASRGSSLGRMSTAITTSAVAFAAVARLARQRVVHEARLLRLGRLDRALDRPLDIARNVADHLQPRLRRPLVVARLPQLLQRGLRHQPRVARIPVDAVDDAPRGRAAISRRWGGSCRGTRSTSGSRIRLRAARRCAAP